MSFNDTAVAIGIGTISVSGFHYLRAWFAAPAITIVHHARKDREVITPTGRWIDDQDVKALGAVTEDWLVHHRRRG